MRSPAHRGAVIASWTYAPAREQFATAVRGQGAHLDGQRLFAGPPAPGPGPRRRHLHPDYTTDEQKRALRALWTDGLARARAAPAGLEYPPSPGARWTPWRSPWEAAWDHAAGLLLVEEAGGAHLTLSGEPFRVTGGNAPPFTAARDAATARRVADLLRTAS